MACTEAIEDELDELRGELAQVRAAITAILGGAQQYSLDTGQTRQVVTRANLGTLRIMRTDLRNEIRLLEAQCDGGAATRVIPGF